MATTVKIERRGASQSVRLPDDFQFDADEVEILRRGDEVILRKKRQNLREAFDLLASMPDDFFAEGREDAPPEVREAL
jgi:antitoxin VapB